MRNLLALTAMALITFVAAGWYLDWYKVKTISTSQPGHKQVTIDVNATKITEDLNKAKAKAAVLLDGSKADPTSTPATTPKTTEPARTWFTVTPASTQPQVPRVPAVPTVPLPPPGSFQDNDGYFVLPGSKK